MKRKLAERLVTLAEERSIPAMAHEIDDHIRDTWVVWVFLDGRGRAPTELNDTTKVVDLTWLEEVIVQ